uniref:Uncharacterized protein n=1 Tax=Cacopsylla melanoneura TaxID=428564 RepID=A0A8D8ZC75_9HEMI
MVKNRRKYYWKGQEQRRGWQYLPVWTSMMDWCRIDLAGVREDQLRFQGDGNIWPVLTPWVGRNWSQRCPTSDSMSISGSFVCIMLDWFVKTGINNIWKISHHGFVPRRCQYLSVLTS